MTGGKQVNINKTAERITTRKSLYVAPCAEVVTLNVTGDIMEYGLIAGSRRAKAGDSWAKRYGLQPVAPDLEGESPDHQDWGEPQKPEPKSLWDD